MKRVLLQQRLLVNFLVVHQLLVAQHELGVLSEELEHVALVLVPGLPVALQQHPADGRVRVRHADARVGGQRLDTHDLAVWRDLGDLGRARGDQVVEGDYEPLWHGWMERWVWT